MNVEIKEVQAGSGTRFLVTAGHYCITCGDRTSAEMIAKNLRQMLRLS